MESGSNPSMIHNEYQLSQENISKNAISCWLNKPSHTTLWSILANSTTSKMFNIDTSSFGQCHCAY